MRTASAPVAVLELEGPISPVLADYVVLSKIGAGGMAAYHAKGFREAGADIVALADVSQAAAEKAAAKHGIAGLTKAYCDELAQYNIQVNGIAPGYYATAITAATKKSQNWSFARNGL